MLIRQAHCEYLRRLLIVDADTGDIAQKLRYDAYGNVLDDTNEGFWWLKKLTAG